MSVIVPIFQVEDLLPRCVDSILAQTYRNLQVILVNDGSPDRCGDICDSYARTDPRVVVIHQKNAGLSAARNAGIGRAEGDYLTFVDSDDWVHCDMVQGLLSLIREDSLEVSACNFIKQPSGSEGGGSLGSVVRSLTNRQAVQALSGPDQANMVIACAKLFPRELFEGIGFPHGRYHEDEFTTFRLLWRAERVIVTSAPWYYYWQRADSITRTHNPRARMDARDGLRTRASFLSSVDLPSDATSAYRKALMMWMNDRVWHETMIDLDDHRTELRALVREFSATKQPLWLQGLGHVWQLPLADQVLARLWRWNHVIRRWLRAGRTPVGYPKRLCGRVS